MKPKSSKAAFKCALAAQAGARPILLILFLFILK
jgi:hypothetical protein